MQKHSDSDFTALKELFQSLGQQHVFTFFDRLSPDRQLDLLTDLARIDARELPALIALIRKGPAAHPNPASMQAPEIVRRENLPSSIHARGEALLSGGKVAAFTVAGGQGTRLGFNGPKGAFAISSVRGKTLFQLFAESILATAGRYGRRAPWYIMTSPSNDAATRDFFVRNGYFGLSPQDILFFQQGVLPTLDRDGRILLEEMHRLALSPDGHGGSLLALARSGMLEDMAARGVEHISYFQVDNPLVYCLDPLFIGLHDERGSEMSSKTLPKAGDFERVGNFAMVDGKLMVIEYSDLPDELARSRNPDGSRKFDAANIAIHLLARQLVERLTAWPEAFALPWHRAEKKVPYIDVETGRRVEPAEPNGIKLEAFIFDALPLAENPILLETSRADEFSPVKNATGVDSVDTARRDMSRRAARWLGAAGCMVPHNVSGDPDGSFEISPLTALESAHLKTRGVRWPTLQPGKPFYLE